MSAVGDQGLWVLGCSDKITILVIKGGETMLARDIMTTVVITVSPGDMVEDVIKLLIENRISGVPVINSNKEVVGVVSEADLMVRTQKLNIPSFINILGGVIYLDDPDEFRRELKKVAAYKVEEIMTEKPLVVDEEAGVERIATLMAEARINRVPVVKDGKLTGIITRADIIKSLARKE